MQSFDREGYSPDFMSRAKAKRVACLTYHKNPGARWDDVEFFTCTVTLASGDIVSMDLAERGSALTNGLWVREVRQLIIFMGIFIFIAFLSGVRPQVV